MAIGDDILIARLTNREAQLMQQADALDVKSSILLVAITFLAGQSTYFLTKYTTGFVHWSQLGSVIIQFVAGFLLAYLLMIRSYPAEATEKYAAWRDRLANYHHGDDAQAEAAFAAGIIQGSIDRIEKGKTINNRKADAIVWTYSLTLLALGFNLAALLKIAVLTKVITF